MTASTNRFRNRPPKCAHARCYERTDQAGTLCPWCTDGLACEHCSTINLTETERAARALMLDSGELEAATLVQLHLLESLMDRCLPHDLFVALNRIDNLMRVQLVHWIHEAQKARAAREIKEPWP